MTDRSDQVTYQEFLSILGADFDRRIVEDPDFLDTIPANAYIAIQIGISDSMDAALRQYLEGFNKWSRDLSNRQLGPGQSLWIAQCSMQPLVSRAATRMTKSIANATCGKYELVAV